jgi:hypothetical protein
MQSVTEALLRLVRVRVGAPPLAGPLPNARAELAVSSIELLRPIELGTRRNGHAASEQWSIRSPTQKDALLPLLRPACATFPLLLVLLHGQATYDAPVELVSAASSTEGRSAGARGEDLLHVLRAMESWRESHALPCRKAELDSCASKFIHPCVRNLDAHVEQLLDVVLVASPDTTGVGLILVECRVAGGPGSTGQGARARGGFGATSAKCPLRDQIRPARRACRPAAGPGSLTTSLSNPSAGTGAARPRPHRLTQDPVARGLAW